MEGNWLILDSGPGAPASNMAWDEALLRAVTRLGAPLLRFYGWTEPAATFGYFQRVAEVEAWTPLRPLIRRPTGGGVVPHDADWTYSFSVPPDHPWYALRAEESYRRLHEWVAAALGRINVAAELSPCCAKQLPGRCFAGPEKFDLVSGGIKIAGAAQRRMREGLLIQGSLQPVPPGAVRGDWQRAMCEIARERHGVHWREFKPDAAVHRMAMALAVERYGRDDYNRRR
jgi:lipoate-protein ligase A